MGFGGEISHVKIDVSIIMFTSMVLFQNTTGMLAQPHRGVNVPELINGSWQ